MINQILALFPDARVSSGYVRIRCPYHKDGKEKRPSMGILLEDRGKMSAGTCHCFSCGKVVTIQQLFKDTDSPHAPEIPRETGVKLVPVQTVTPLYKPQLPFRFSPYLQGRGISEQTQSRFRIYEKDGKVHMPVFDREGRFKYSCARSTAGKQFFVETGAQKTLWGIEEIDLAQPIAICEGQIDAMSLWEIGIQAVATLGADNTRCLSEISQSTSTFILAFDLDPAGIEATRKASNLLGSWRCSILDLPPNVDVNRALQDIADKRVFERFIYKSIMKM